MALNDKVTQLENEIKVLKNEVQAVLLDLRESYLNRENPFNPAAPPTAAQPIIINQQPPILKQEQDEVTAKENQKSEPVGLEEPANKPERVREQEPIGDKKIAHEEVERAWRPKLEPESQSIESGETIDGPGGKADLATIAGLTRWVAESTKRLGRKRTEAILDISEMMGHLPPNIKGIVAKLINLAPDGYSGEVTTRDYLALLLELTSLLGKGNKSEVALLSILCQENDHR